MSTARLIFRKRVAMRAAHNLGKTIEWLKSLGASLAQAVRLIAQVRFA